MTVRSVSEKHLWQIPKTTLPASISTKAATPFCWNGGSRKTMGLSCQTPTRHLILNYKSKGFWLAFLRIGEDGEVILLLAKVVDDFIIAGCLESTNYFKFWLESRFKLSKVTIAARSHFWDAKFTETHQGISSGTWDSTQKRCDLSTLRRQV